MKEKIKKILFIKTGWFFAIFLVLALFFLIYLGFNFDIVELNKLKTNDLVYILGTLILAGIAIFRESLTKMFLKPELEIIYENYPPYSHQTKMDFNIYDPITGKLIDAIRDVPVYYFSFLVLNKGKKQAKNCEAILEGISRKDENGNWIKENYIPANLKWVMEGKPQFISINPERRIYCNIGHITHPDYQNREPSDWRFMPVKDKEKPVVKLELRERFYYQMDCLPPGEYKIRVAIYSENDKKREKTFEVKWTGNWRENEEEMLDREIKII